MPHSIKKCLILFLSLSCLSAFSPQVQAQKNRAITAEEVAIAFYKTGNIVPSFESWIKESDTYLTTPLGRRDEVFEKQDLRLKKLYQDFSVENNLLKIRTSAHVKLSREQDENKRPNYFVEVVIDEENEVTYFPYKFLDQNIMVIPNHFQKLKKQPISKTEYDYIKSVTEKGNRFPLILKLKSKESDFTHPYVVDDIPQWAFLTDIATIESWTKSNQLIWQYSAPWYLSPEERKIHKIYKSGDELLQNGGHVKPLGNIK